MSLGDFFLSLRANAVTKWKRVLSSDFKVLLEIMDTVCSGLKRKRIIQTVISAKLKEMIVFMVLKQL